MFLLLASLRKNRRLLSDLVRRDLRARYVGSSMGFFWSVLFPIISLFIYMFVFRIVLKTRWSDHQGTAEVALLMLCGIMVWQAFAESVSRMTNSLADNSNLIQKTVFPSEVLPAYLTISSLINMLIGLAVALLGVVWFAYVSPSDETKPLRPAEIHLLQWGPRSPEDAATAPVITNAFNFCAASRAATTHYGEHSVSDSGEKPWTQAAAGMGPAGFDRAGWGDLVLAETGEWATAESKTNEKRELGIDRWRDRRGEPCAAPRDGTACLVVGEPDRAMGLSISLVSVPVLILLQGVFMLGLGYLLSAFNLFLRDTYHMIGVFLTVWMFATPIFYPERLVRNAGYGWIPDYNPMHWLVICYRDVLVYGSWPAWHSLWTFALAGWVLLVLGSTFFLKHKPRFPDLL